MDGVINEPSSPLETPPSLARAMVETFARTCKEGQAMKAVHAVIFVLLLFVTPNLQASDFAKEQRWADQTVDTLVEGDAKWLQAGGHRFLAIYTEAKAANPKLGVILLHGRGAHPDWRQVIYPLRTGLAERGMPTLSLQMPILPNEAKAIEYAPLIAEADPRIAAGIQFLKAQGIKEIVLVGHSLGTVMAAHYLAGGAPDIKAFVGVNFDVFSNEPRMDTLAFLRRIHIPVLDLYGSDASPEVVDTAKQRVAAAHAAGNKAYRQIRIAGANQYFDDKDTVLLDTVSKWLSSL
jgi:pimeloyl-ACP methyl ester carboxylesterase